MVPFSPAAGLLEWVEDTVPLGRYLIGEDRMSGAHRRYARPGELSFFDAYKAMDKGQQERRPRQAFDKVQGYSAMHPQLSPQKSSHAWALLRRGQAITGALNLKASPGTADTI